MQGFVETGAILMTVFTCKDWVDSKFPGTYHAKLTFVYCKKCSYLHLSDFDV